MISLWEQRSFVSYDVVVVGAGISGLSTAASLIERDPDLRVLVLERGTLPTGASTRNAGFACFGSLTELLADQMILGSDGMTELVERRWKGLQKTRQRLGVDAMDLQQKGGWELLDKPAEAYSEPMEQINNLLMDIFRERVFCDKSEELADLGMQGFQGLLHNQFEGQIDTGKTMANLWRYCATRGVSVLTGTTVNRYEAHDAYVEVVTPTLTFRCRQLVLCTNAFTQDLVATDLSPGRGTVIVVEPKRRLSFEGTFHYDEGYYYFRDFYGQLVFGGGRNLDKAAEATTEFAINPEILGRLKDDLERKILPDQQYQITHQWSGIMAFGESKGPIVERIGERVSMGVRLGGMGVAIGSLVGEELAQLVMPSVR